MLTLRFAKSQKRFGNTYRLVLVVAPPGGGKTRVLHELHERIAAPLLDVNLELSRRMLDHNERQRALQMPRLFANILAECPDELVLLDNTEILFDASLKQDPLRLLQGVARSKTVVAAWSGSVDNEHIFSSNSWRSRIQILLVTRHFVSGFRISRLKMCGVIGSHT